MPVLRSANQGRLLEALVAEPGREWKLADLAAHAGVSAATAMREVDRAERAGILTSRRVGNTRLVAADPASPFVEPLQRLLVPTFGVPRVLREEFGGLAGLRGVYVVGSWAAAWHGEAQQPRDVDVLIIADGIDRGAVYEAADRAEKRLGVPVDVIVRSSGQWHSPRPDEPWLDEVLRRPIVEVIGAETSGGDGR